MFKTLRPSVEAFKKAGWHPVSNEAYKEWMKDLTDRVCHPTYTSRVPLLPSIQAFKDFIETNPTVYQEFIRMFEGVTEPVCVLCSVFESVIYYSMFIAHYIQRYAEYVQ